jgi:hypothetical protein
MTQQTLWHDKSESMNCEDSELYGVKDVKVLTRKTGESWEWCYLDDLIARAEALEIAIKALKRVSTPNADPASLYWKDISDGALSRIQEKLGG